MGSSVKKSIFVRYETCICNNSVKLEGYDKTNNRADGDLDFSWSPDSRFILCDYQADGGWNNSDVALIDIESVKVLSKGTGGRLVPSPDGKTLFLINSISIKKLDPDSGKTTSISFSDEYDYYPAQERSYIFSHAWKQVKEKFYDENHNGEGLRIKEIAK